MYMKSLPDKSLSFLDKSAITIVMIITIMRVNNCLENKCDVYIM